MLTINQFNTAYSLKSETDFAIARNQREQDWRKSQCGAIISKVVFYIFLIINEWVAYACEKDFETDCTCTLSTHKYVRCACSNKTG